MKVLTVAFIWVMLARMTVQTSFICGDKCPGAEDYTPCTCQGCRGTWRLTCDGVTANELRDVLRKTTVTVFQAVDISLSKESSAANLEDIPMDVLEGKRASSIRLACSAREHQLRVDAEAFASTKQSTNRFEINHCDLSKLNLTFLADFNEITSFNLINSTHVHLALPSLPKLRNLTSWFGISYCSGLNELRDYPPPLAAGLGVLYLTKSEMNDDAMDRMLDWILSSSKDTLWAIHMNDNHLTRMPKQLSSFTQLSTVHADGNAISVVSTDSVVFTGSTLISLSLHNCKIELIQPNAFKGDFSRTLISLGENKFKKFEADIFQPILEQQVNMTERLGGEVNLHQNTFDCDDCHLAWLIRDHGNLLAAVSGGVCSNGTAFEDLKSIGFNHCAAQP